MTLFFAYHWIEDHELTMETRMSIWKKKKNSTNAQRTHDKIKIKRWIRVPTKKTYEIGNEIRETYIATW